MIECWVRCGDGSEWTLPTATQWEFCYGTGLPCDSFRVRCLWDGGVEQRLSDAALFFAQWNGERVFTGVVDEFECVCGGDGAYLEISGRSMAARLLDNEAMPTRYQLATCADIIENHVKPYGIETVGGDFLSPVSEFTVSSGVSEWSVVQEFACCYGGIVPRFDRMGRLVLAHHEDTEMLVVDAGTVLTGWEHREQRHGVLSSVAVRRRTDWGVQWVENQAFLEQGGCARRVITVPNGTGSAAMRYSADYQLRASAAERVRVTLNLKGGFLAWPGQLVELSRSRLRSGRYRVAQTEVSCGEEGLCTTLILGEADSLI